MHKKIFKTGHSLAVTLAKKDLENLSLKLGDTVSIVSDKDRQQIIIRPEKRQAQLSLNLNTRYKLGAMPQIKK